MKGQFLWSGGLVGCLGAAVGSMDGGLRGLVLWENKVSPQKEWLPGQPHLASPSGQKGSLSMPEWAPLLSDSCSREALHRHLGPGIELEFYSLSDFTEPQSPHLENGNSNKISFKVL